VSPEGVVRRFVDELWNLRRLEVTDEIIAADCVTHQLKSGLPQTGERRGPAEIRAHIREWLDAFPDMQYRIEQMFVSGDRVISELVVEGTHRGEWLGLPPTGRHVAIRLMTIHRIANGKIAEDWVILESAGFLGQLGLVAPLPELIAQARAS